MIHSFFILPFSFQAHTLRPRDSAVRRFVPVPDIRPDGVSGPS